jgi:hypothetical protein
MPARFLFVNERSDSADIRQRNRIVDYHAQIGPAVDRKG